MRRNLLALPLLIAALAFSACGDDTRPREAAATDRAGDRGPHGGATEAPTEAADRGGPRR